MLPAVADGGEVRWRWRCRCWSDVPTAAVVAHWLGWLRFQRCVNPRGRSLTRNSCGVLLLWIHRYNPLFLSFPASSQLLFINPNSPTVHVHHSGGRLLLHCSAIIRECTHLHRSRGVYVGGLIIMHMVGGVRLEHGWLDDVPACFYTVA